jgi:hypothetical protein
MLRGARAFTALLSIASTDYAPKLAGRAVSARRALAVAALVAMSGGAAADVLGVPDRNRPKREWPDSPVKNFLEGLKRPDNDKHPERDSTVQSCCDAADTVRTRFRVQPAGGDYPQDRWYAWLNDRWVAIPPEVIVPEYAPDGRAYLFVINVSDEMDGERDIQVIACFVRPRGGL